MGFIRMEGAIADIPEKKSLSIRKRQSLRPLRVRLPFI